MIDSGSTDGSHELIEEANPAHFIRIQPQEYIPGRVLNTGLEMARSNFVIFVNADATPQGANWLRPLVNALLDPQTAAVFGRQIPRPDCQAVFACDYDRCFGPERESAQWDHFFSMANSGLRKDVWQQRKFSETLRYSEDDEYTRWWKAQGYRIVYCPDSVVMHSHNYTPAQAYKRGFGEGQALAFVWPGKASDMNPMRTLLLGWANDLSKDVQFCTRHRRWSELPYAARIRWQLRRGRLAGFQEGWKLYRQ